MDIINSKYITNEYYVSCLCLVESSAEALVSLKGKLMLKSTHVNHWIANQHQLMIYRDYVTGVQRYEIYPRYDIYP